MSVALAPYGYKITWNDILIDEYKGYYPNMTDYHMHKYYELSIIISGNVNVLLKDSVESSTESKIVLLRPFTPHYIYCEPDILYRRVNICFSSDFISEYSPEWQQLMGIFAENGAVLKLDKENCAQYVELANKIKNETNLLRKKLLLMYLISLIADNMQLVGEFTNLPLFVTKALAYISGHYSEKIIAADLAERLNVSRTTLMTAFKKHTGTTLNDYLAGCRLKHAVAMLKSGAPLSVIAENCGFNNSPNLIRCFKRHFDMTPSQYIAKNK